MAGPAGSRGRSTTRIRRYALARTATITLENQYRSVRRQGLIVGPRGAGTAARFMGSGRSPAEVGRASGFGWPWARELDHVGWARWLGPPVHRRKEPLHKRGDRIGLGVGAVEQQ